MFGAIRRQFGIEYKYLILKGLHLWKGACGQGCTGDILSKRIEVYLFG